MESSIDITVSLRNGQSTNVQTFNNERLIINRAGPLWIKNNGDGESEFIETVKMWNKMDLNTGTTTHYNFKTNVPTQIVQSLSYKVDRIAQEGQAIFFEEV